MRHGVRFSKWSILDFVIFDDNKIKTQPSVALKIVYLLLHKNKRKDKMKYRLGNWKFVMLSYKENILHIILNCSMNHSVEAGTEGNV